MDMAHKISIYEYRIEWCYYEHSTAFYANLYELLKAPSRVEQLAKEGYVVIDRYLDRRFDRALDLEFLEALQDHFLELERKGELYTTGHPDPYRLFLYQPGVTSKLLAQSTIKVQAVLGPHTIRYENSRAYMNVIYCDTNFIGPEEKEYLIERYGAPTYTKESRGELVTANSVSNSGRHIPSSSDNLKAKGAKALERITAGDTTLRSASLVSLAMSNTLSALLLSSVPMCPRALSSPLLRCSTV